MAAIAETERLIIRTWNRDDLNELRRLTNDAGLADFSISGYSNFTVDQALEWIDTEVDRFSRSGLGKFAVIRKVSQEIIGISGLFAMPEPYASSIEMNYRYPARIRGNGFAFEAAGAIVAYGFSKLNLKEINAIIDPQNAASSNLAQKLGFKKLGQILYLGLTEDHWRLVPGT
jgi:RimJ/RimL family protein N-acetyltransferase